jgi:transcriptional regulator with XRE-family HTH domain
MPNISDINPDAEISKMVGGRLQAHRLQRNLTVEDVATRAGLNRNTVLNAERGANPRLMTVIRLLRALDRLDSLDAFLPPPRISPLALLERKGKPRRRASKPRRG